MAGARHPITDDEIALLLREYGIDARPVRPDYFRQALRHSSAVELRESSSAGGSGPAASLNNERLEFVGDALLDAIVADELFRRYGRENEGYLSKARARLVENATLGALARAAGFERWLQLGPSMAGSSGNLVLLASALEAWVAALFYDAQDAPGGSPGLGFERARTFVLRLLTTHGAFASAAPVLEEERNYKDALQRWFAAGPEHTPPAYALLEETGPAHARAFRVVVYAPKGGAGVGGGVGVGGGEEAAPLPLAEGSGDSKKGAEQDAARRALVRLGLLDEAQTLTPAFHERVAPSAASRIGHGADYKSQLQRFFQAKYPDRPGPAQVPRYVTVGEGGPPHAPVFTVAVHAPFTDRQLATGAASSRKAAEQEAARAALAELGLIPGAAGSVSGSAGGAGLHSASPAASPPASAHLPPPYPFPARFSSASTPPAVGWSGASVGPDVAAALSAALAGSVRDWGGLAGSSGSVGAGLSDAGSAGAGGIRFARVPSEGSIGRGGSLGRETVHSGGAHTGSVAEAVLAGALRTAAGAPGAAGAGVGVPTSSGSAAAAATDPSSPGAGAAGLGAGSGGSAFFGAAGGLPFPCAPLFAPSFGMGGGAGAGGGAGSGASVVSASTAGGSLTAGENFKGRLNEFCQRAYLPPPRYEQVGGAEGPPHAPVFRVACTLMTPARAPLVTVGSGSNKKAAEQDAARAALAKLTGEA